MKQKPVMLVVDDIEINRAILRNIFSPEFTILECTGGEEALALLHGENHIDLVLLDLYMPGMDGFEVLRRMREDPELSEVPVLANTQYGDKENEVKALALGATDFITKPYHNEAVQHRVHHVMNRLMMERQLERDRRKAIARLQNQAERDGLTGVWNRETFYRRAEELLYQNPEESYVILRWDIRNFKVINDLFGTEKGDQLLRNLADTLVIYIGQLGLFGRLEADHFAAIIPNAQFRLEEILALTDVCTVPGTTYDVSVHLGIFQVKDHHVPVVRMCDRAKLAIHSVKDNFVQRYAFYDTEMRQKVLWEQEVSSSMKYALESGQLQVYFQPIYSMTTGQPVSAEALIRWNHPDRGLLTPGQFVPILEKNGFITNVDIWVLDRVCRYQRSRGQSGRPMVPVSVNLSRNDLDQPNLCRNLIDTVEYYQLTPSDIKFEITETMYTHNRAQLLETMRTLQSQGFQVLMDDFGSGYSSLNMLKDVPVDILKIDMCLVNDLGSSDRAGNILGSVIRMAKWLDMQVVAEGVETQAQMAFLRSISCDQAQGYYYAKPMPAEEFSALLDESRAIHTERSSPLPDEFDFESMWSSNDATNLLLRSMIGGMGIYELQGDSLEAVRVNDGYYEIFGGTPDTVFRDAKAAYRRVHEKDWPILLDTCRRAESEGQVEQCTIRRYHQKGQMLWVDVKVRYLGSRGGRSLFYFAVYDVTERRNGEQNLYLRRYLAALKAVYSKLYELNFTTGIVHTIYSDGKEPFGEYATLEEVCRAMELRHVHPDDVETYLRGFNADEMDAEIEASSDGRFTSEVRLRADLEQPYHWFTRTIIRLDTGDDQRVYLSGRADVTDRKQAENDKFLRELLAHLPVGVSIYELGDQIELKYANEQVQKMFGMTESQMAETLRQTGRQFTGQERKTLDELRALAPGAVRRVDTLTMYHQTDGTPCWLRAFTTNVGGDGTPTQCYAVLADVTDNKEQEADYRRKEELFRMLLQRSEMLIFEYEIEADRMEYSYPGANGGREIVVQEHFAETLSKTGLIYPDDVGGFLRLSKQADGISQGEMDYRGDYFGKGYRWYRAFYNGIYGPDGRQERLIGMCLDVEAEKTLAVKLEEAATDGVSGLWNRAATEERIRKAIVSDGAAYAYFLYDLDNFKQVNDTYGHQEGDHLLVQLAQVLRASFRDADIIGRIGGDEFVVLMRNLTGPEVAQERARATVEAIKALSERGCTPAPVSVSLGVAYDACGHHDFETLYQQADLALYQAKREGKNKFVFLAMEEDGADCKDGTD